VALAAGINKVVEYYKKTAESDVYIFAMCMWHNSSAYANMADLDTVLDPSGKGEHLQRYWTPALYHRALKEVEQIVRTSHSSFPRTFFH
jgi:hypothetical protein